MPRPRTARSAGLAFEICAEGDIEPRALWRDDVIGAGADHEGQATQPTAWPSPGQSGQLGAEEARYRSIRLNLAYCSDYF